MKKIKIALVILFGLIAQKGTTQITQLELASGIDKTDFTSFSIQPIHKKNTFSIATLAFFQKYHQKEEAIFDEIGVQTTGFWNFSKFLSIGPSLYYNSVAGFSQRLSLLLNIGGENFTISLIPSLAYLRLTDNVNGELFGQIQLFQPLKKYWKLLLSAQILSHWDKFSMHARSFQQIRAGFSHKGTQFGYAVDFDQYGENSITKTSMGLFLRKVFLSK